ncbi:septum site-determining protein MinC [Lysinibacillus alkalisoli]|uniref:Probable septum site-determining protein MinC n=1 Tax=Lysinibacillus alkalisoli TaxID=1911548 RepID=A0A917G859_9BACI|nr:septum site-determining protein MinC [Lysinibacillus alkalisoli]GGG27545.1 septum site-determining protein MinC [Lysinibacillus alkalisoli]
MKQVVHMKGTKDGFIIKLDDKAAYQDLLIALMELAESYTTDRQVDVQLHLGYRYCSEEEQERLVAAIEKTNKLHVTQINSDVVTKQESEAQLIKLQNEMYVGMVRSGQVLRADGDVFIVGNVNQNGRVVAGGNIYILGRLKGMAYAGQNGNEHAVVAASYFEATHICIGEVMETMSNEKVAQTGHTELTCAHLNEQGVIAYKPIHELRNMPSFFMTAKGGN